MASWQAGMVNAHAQTFHGFPTAAPPTRLHNMQAAAPPPPPPMGLGGNNDKDMTMSWPTLGGAPQNAAAARMSMKESSLSSAMNNHQFVGGSSPNYSSPHKQHQLQQHQHQVVYMDSSSSPEKDYANGFHSPVSVHQAAVRQHQSLSPQMLQNGRASQLDASAPIWTPSPKQKGAGEEHGYSWARQKQRTSYAAGWRNAAPYQAQTTKYHQHSQQQQPGSWSGSVSPMNSPMAMMMSSEHSGVLAQQPGSPLGSSPSSPGTGVFLPSSVSSRRHSKDSGMMKFGGASQDMSDGSTFSLPDELF